MAQTYTVACVGIAPAANKSMIAIYNGAGSGRIVRLYRAWMLNNGVTVVTGVVSIMNLVRLSTGSGGNAITPTKHDSTNENFPAQIVVGNNMTVTVSEIFRRWIWSYDEASAAVAATLDEFECVPPFTLIWDVGYGETNIEPFVCREGYGVSIQNVTTTVVGSVDLFFEVTLAAS